jgi:hypothetical protein
VHFAARILLAFEVVLNGGDFFCESGKRDATLHVGQFMPDAMTGSPQGADPTHRLMDSPKMAFDLSNQVELAGGQMLCEAFQIVEDLSTGWVVSDTQVLTSRGRLGSRDKPEPPPKK